MGAKLLFRLRPAYAPRQAGSSSLARGAARFFGAAARHSRIPAREAWLGMALALFLTLMLAIPACQRQPPASQKTALRWEPGYWRVLPELGLTRVIPLAGSVLISPAAGAGAGQIRLPAEP